MEALQTNTKVAIPLWGWVLSGWLLAGAAVAWIVGDSPPPPHTQMLAKQAEIDWDLKKMSPRELRTLPEIGAKRAVEIARQRWRKRLDSPIVGVRNINLQGVRGIGPKTDHSVRRFMQRRLFPPGTEVFPPSMR